MKKIRNFCIIAHIDHGKSTLADRFLELTKRLEKREMKNSQMMDTMELEQERGITIKLQPVNLYYQGYYLNLIDTPGHVDFRYEVSRSLAACEGAILLVDATQGIEAQTLANLYLALDHNLTIIPVINKIDLPAANPEQVKEDLVRLLGVEKSEIIAVSAKTGENVDLILKSIIENVPDPSTNKYLKDIEKKETKALVFDSVYDQYKGVLAYLRVFNGKIKKGDTAYFLGTNTKIQVLEVGEFTPVYKPLKEVQEGSVAYVVTGLKTTSEAKVGDTFFIGKDPSREKMLPGYKNIDPVVYAGMFTIDSNQYNLLREALEKLSLNDSALTFEPVQASALGYGFRCGFLGMLHMEIVQERLEREYNLEVIISSPSVNYEVVYSNGKVDTISSPDSLPDRTKYKELREPYAILEIIVPNNYLGNVNNLVKESRGEFKAMEMVDSVRSLLKFEVPLSMIITDFFDQLKSITQGYASMSYENIGFRVNDLVKVDILVAGEKIDALSFISHRSLAESEGRKIALRLKEVIPKHQFAVALQAVIGGKIIARETVPAMRKDVTAKLYGGDVSRKRKVLEKQKKGKSRLKALGKVTLNQESFLSVLKK